MSPGSNLSPALKNFLRGKKELGIQVCVWGWGDPDREQKDTEQDRWDRKGHGWDRKGHG